MSASSEVPCYHINIINRSWEILWWCQCLYQVELLSYYSDLWLVVVDMPFVQWLHFAKFQLWFLPRGGKKYIMDVKAFEWLVACLRGTIKWRKSSSPTSIHSYAKVWFIRVYIANHVQFLVSNLVMGWVIKQSKRISRVPIVYSTIACTCLSCIKIRVEGFCIR